MVICAAGLVVAACGLEEYVYLEPPSSTAKVNEIYTFSNNISNDPTVFMGYKILYRFFPSSDKVDQSISSVASQFASSPTTIYTVMKDSLGYRDLKIDTDDKIEINFGNRQDPFTVEIDFSRATQGIDDKNVLVSIPEGGIATTPGLPKNAYRNTEQTDIGFSSEYLVTGYNDLVQETNYSDVTGETYLLLFVLAYGLNPSTYTDVFSEPKLFVGTPNYLFFTVEL